MLKLDLDTMIIIKNLTKKYSIRGNDDVVALSNINITLPDKGLVFVIGKSGSGKTTLLNLLGSLDSPTNGEIIADGTKVHAMNESEASIYRNDYVGFIFQDFCLIDTLSVEDNIKVSLDIKNQNDAELINESLKLVDLEGFNKRLPRSLSAGQKQRVAIARGYIKKPRLLLCDEPTGNLDSKTSEQILDILKKLSQETLVVIVSHNVEDAYKYADRIIEISDGKIVKDLTNEIGSSNYIVQEDKLYVSSVDRLSKEDLETINKKIENKEIKSLHSHNELFVEKKENDGEMHEISLQNHTYSFKNKTKLAWKFQKKRIFSSFIISIISATLMVLFGLCQFFNAFSLNDVVKKTLESGDQNVFALKKAYYADNRHSKILTSSLVSITDEDINNIASTDYKGKVYPLYSYHLPISLDSWSLLNEITVNDSNNFKELYIQETYGVLPLDEDYLHDLFGNYEIVGNPNDKEDGLIITDFVADSILHYRNDTYQQYEEILGKYANKDNSSFAYINAIIKTDYKTKYKDVIDQFTTYYQESNYKELDDLLNSDEYLHFFEDVKNRLGINYSLNQDFINASISLNARDFTMLTDTQVEVPEHAKRIDIASQWASIDNKYGYHLPNNTMGISLETFKKLLSLPDSTTYEEVSIYNNTEINLIRYRKYHPDNVPVLTKSINIQIFDTGYFGYIASEDLLLELRKYDVIPYAIYLNDLNTASNAYMALMDTPFIARSSMIEAGVEINKVVTVFSDLFVLILLFVLVGILLIQGFYIFIALKMKQKDIGILKALGMKNKDLTIVYILQNCFVMFITLILFSIGLVIFTNVANGILYNSFMSYLKNPALKMINILTFNPVILIIDLFVIIGINIWLILVPFIVMKRIKPIDIIRE